MEENQNPQQNNDSGNIIKKNEFSIELILILAPIFAFIISIIISLLFSCNITSGPSQPCNILGFNIRDIMEIFVGVSLFGAYTIPIGLIILIVKNYIIKR